MMSKSGKALQAALLAALSAAALNIAGPAMAADCVQARAGTARLGDVRFTTASGWLQPATLAAIASDHATCQRDVASVETVIEAVNAAYAAVGADLAFADFAGTDGDVVLIELVEIRYGTVTVADAPTTRDDYITARSGVAVGDLVDLQTLQDNLERLPTTDDIRVEADLQPGAAPGTSDLILRVTEPPAVRRILGVDNRGSPDSGRATVSGVLSIASLTGLRDPLTLSLTASEGTTQGVFGYTRPIGTSGARLSFGLSAEQTRALRAAPPLDALKTQALFGSVGYAQPLRISQTAVDTLALSVSVSQDRGTLSGVGLFDLTTLELSVGSTHLRQIPGRGLVTLSQGLKFGQVDDRVTPADFSYLRHTGALSGVALMGANWTLGAELRWQIADRALPTFARFSVGGIAGVRGYRVLGTTDDEGVLLRSELRRNPFALAETGMTLSPFFHADLGRGTSFGAGNRRIRGDLRRSVGVGIDMRHPLTGDRSLVGSIVVSVPLDDAGTRVRRHDPEVIAALSIEF